MIVSFLTPNEIKVIVPDNIMIERLDINEIKVPTKLKLPLLMCHIGRVLLIGKCLKKYQIVWTNRGSILMEEAYLEDNNEN